MLVPLAWLKEYVKVNVTPAKLAERLLLAGTKVEEISKTAGHIVFNLEITPNRPDTLSIYGVAREVSAIFDEDLHDIDTDLLRNLPIKGTKPTIKVVDKKLCPFYSLVRLNNVTVIDSPDWLKDYLIAAGIRPINNLVDITNFVMLELGQPMHAFDADKISGQLTMRASYKGEKVRTLDSVERILPEGAIIIEDTEKLVDLAGLMGGENSEVDSHTKNVLLHVPVYEPVAIRKTSLTTGLRTEASGRFEKKLDPNLHPIALKRAVKLYSELANSQSISPINTVGYPAALKSLDFPTGQVKNILGLDLKVSDVINILSPLGFLVKPSLQEDNLSIQIPSHRQDVAIAEDILEEIGRIYGYNNFPKSLPCGSIPLQKETFQPSNYDLLRQEVLKAGFSELTGYTLVPEKDLANFEIPKDKAVRVMHPTSSDFEYLRPTLLINLLKAVETNQGQVENLAFFEIAKEFHTEIDPATKLPRQNTTLGLTSTKSYREIKGVVETILSAFDLKLTQVPAEDQLGSGVDYLFGKRLVAKVATLREGLVKKYQINSIVNSAWIDYDFFEKLPVIKKYQPEAKFPPIIEDISLFLPKQVTTAEIVEFLTHLDPQLAQVEFLDAFSKDGQPSITLRLQYQNPDKTLTDKDAKSLREKVKKALKVHFKVTIRDN